MLGYDALQELEQQFQVPVAGAGASVAANATTTLVFDVEFFDAPEQRDSSLTVPHFTFGAYLEGQVMISASVLVWTTDSRGAFIGAEVTIGVCAPGSAIEVPYSGYVHLTFQGYGAISENVDTLDVGT